MSRTPLPYGPDTQMMKAGLGLCLLALLRERPRYGHELVKELGARGLRLPNGRSVYPLLKRLEKEGVVEAGGLVESGHGPPRKYYRLSAEGEALFEARAAAFLEFAGAVEDIVGAGRSASDGTPANLAAMSGTHSGT